MNPANANFPLRKHEMSSKYDDLSNEELVALLHARDKRDATRFGLVWEANEIERDRALNDDFVALDLNPTLSCGSAPWQNLIIEGDNFDALRYLKMVYSGSVKCIFIDPPYNTGNKDFVYNDHYVDKDDLWKHSKWCEFLYQRLLLARDLLTQDGVIFVSIDDNEFAPLKLIMDKVFGSQNFEATCVWQKKYSAANDHKSIAPMHDYILVYSAFGNWQRNLLPREKGKDKQYRLEDDRGVFRADNYTCNKSAEERPNLYYPIVQPNSGEEVWPNKNRVWAYSKEEHQKHIEQDFIYWGKDGKGKVPSFKRYKHLLRNDGIVPNTWWTFDEAGHTDAAKKELLSILPEAERAFSTPKPTKLIQRILQIATKPGDLVLDFFAGSGTTAHALLNLNATDGGDRKFILVSNSESTDEEPNKNLCRDICARRVKRVIEGNDENEPHLSSFAYLKCQRIAKEKVIEIDHEQVWTALQLTHFGQVSPYDSTASLQCFEDENTCMVYLPSVKEAAIHELNKQLSNKTAVVLYSWQPEWLKHHVCSEHVQFESIPEALTRRFGLQSKGGM